jgi:hypothetical protein
LRAYGLRVPSVPRIARDFSLGPLQSYRPAADSDEAAILAVARSFMDGLVEGTLDSKLLLPEARDALLVLLAPPKSADTGASAPPKSIDSGASAPPKSSDTGPSAAPPSATAGNAPAYRLGAIVIDIGGEDASLKARLPSAVAAGGTADRREGLLSLRKVAGSWYVEALALDPPSSGPLTFDPSEGAIKGKAGSDGD